MTKLNMDLVCQVAVVVPDLKKGLESFRRLFAIDEDSLSYSDSTDAYRAVSYTHLAKLDSQGLPGAQMVEAVAEWAAQ